MPHVLCTHNDFRRATTAELLGLFLSPAVIDSDALATLNKILTETPRNKPGRQLHAAIELARRQMLLTLMDMPVITSASATAHYLQMHFLGRASEVFAVVYLDTRHRILAVEDLFFGTIDSATVHPREIVRNALLRNAAAVVLAHNHPSGVAEPSIADIALTKNIKDALTLLGIRLLDHVVVGQGTSTSLAERGLI